MNGCRLVGCQTPPDLALFGDFPFPTFFFLFMSPQQTDHVALVNVTADNVKMLSKLNAVIFPVQYGTTFYRDVLYVGELAKLGMI